jgi:hypothetical protein
MVNKHLELSPAGGSLTRASFMQLVFHFHFRIQ